MQKHQTCGKTSNQPLIILLLYLNNSSLTKHIEEILGVLKIFEILPGFIVIVLSRVVNQLDGSQRPSY